MLATDGEGGVAGREQVMAKMLGVLEPTLTELPLSLERLELGTQFGVKALNAQLELGGMLVEVAQFLLEAGVFCARVSRGGPGGDRRDQFLA